MRRIKFGEGGQKVFFDLVIEKMSSPSLRGLLQFGIEVNYSTLKNYYLGERLLPEDLFVDLCELARINLGDLDFEYLGGSWGQVKGGRLGKRASFKSRNL